MRVLLVDDSVMIREGLKMLLGNYRNLAIAGEASTGRELSDLLPRCRPDVVLMDIRLKDESGIDLCTRLRQLCPRLPVLFLTAYDDHDLLHDAMGAGGQGFLTKDASGATIAASLEALATGQPFLDPHATDYLLARLRRGVFLLANLNPGIPKVETCVVCRWWPRERRTERWARSWVSRPAESKDTCIGSSDNGRDPSPDGRKPTV